MELGPENLKWAENYFRVQQLNDFSQIVNSNLFLSIPISPGRIFGLQSFYPLTIIVLQNRGISRLPGGNIVEAGELNNIKILPIEINSVDNCGNKQRLILEEQ